MREILFRGKRLDNGEWAEGYYAKCRGHHYILPSYDLDHGFDERYSDWIEVDPETVCQRTGLADRKGRKIFESDVIVIPHSNKKGLPAEVRYMERDGGFRIERVGYVPIILNEVQYWGEVIGNIFDNPYLIEWKRSKLRITPRKPTDRGGYLTMPLVSNVPRPSDKTWKKTTCPVCGKECWDRPLPEGFIEEMFVGKRCTMCALKAAGV
jgi:hypothetical protein